MSRSLTSLGVAVVVCALSIALPARASAQTESQLLNQAAQNPEQVSAYLDLAKLYFQQHRFDEAQKVLSQAMAVIQRQQTVWARPTLSASATPGAPRPQIQAGPDRPLRVGGDVHEPRKIKDVKPVYPEIALASKVAGVVILEITIGTDGGVEEAKILRSIALLDQAALDAVRQWRFTPSLLNGQPVQVVMTVTVNFSLPGGGTR